MVHPGDADHWPARDWAHQPLVRRHPIRSHRNSHRPSGRPLPARQLAPEPVRIKRWAAGSLVASGLTLAWFVLVTLRPVATGRPADAVGEELSKAVTETIQAERILSVVQWAASVATTLAVGGMVFALFVARLRPNPTTATGTLRWSAYAGIAAELVSLPVRAVEVAGTHLTAAWDPEVLRFVVATRFGDAALVRVGGLALLARAAGPGPGARIRGIVGALLVLVSYALIGHPQATDPAYLLVPTQAVHVLAVSTWFGGLVFLALELRQQRTTGTARVGAEVVKRFSTLATTVVVLAGVTGVVLAWSQVHSLAALRTTAYGRALLVKLAVLTVPLAIGGYNRQRLVPAIVCRDEPAAWRRLGRTLALEATFIALGVLLATAAMTSGGFP